MSYARFHCPTLQPGLNLLDEADSRHATAALRLAVGDGAVLFDGAGREGCGVIEIVTRGSVGVRVAALCEKPFEAAYRITLAVAMAKAHRQSYLIEKCTELGLAAFWPLLADRSVTRPGDAAVDKWARRAVEAAKQAGRAWVPRIESPMRFADAVKRVGEFAAAALTDLNESAAPYLSFLSAQTPGASILVFVGPEGGWSDTERNLARESGIRTVRLAPTILRAETAGVAVCAAAGLLSVKG